ncbi:hypothetical protein J2X31_001624 [Flavobacterium arsenatis]|uniref:Omp28-related outer membrane protein n=1 Tax=Flavobacterium arsenatis TaxID=1484332 RepID=A0ABU1TQG4_9FLAO|nr:Omp28-related outer membrane protein [Flavobacterium arsenatis]MDR6967612.1 hypothetical protein [Flavobacterium arsenatis]
MKILKILFLSFLFIGINACSSDEDEDSTAVASITLTPSTTTQMIGEPVTFVVTTDTGENVTAGSALSAGNTSITGATFTSQTTGPVVVTATYLGATATTTVTFTDIPPTSITLTASANAQAINESIIFKVVTNTGIDVTSTSVITAGSSTVNGDRFTSTTVGTFDVSATYGNLTSENITITFGQPISFTKRVLIEDYTGTWCGWCPRVSYGIELVQNATDKAVVVAIHRVSTNPTSGAYDPYSYNANSLESLINLQGYPTAKLNRLTTWNSPEPNNINQVVGLTNGETPKVGISMTSSVSNGTINLAVNTKFGKGLNGSKLVVYVLENGLVHNQVNYTTYYGGTGGNSVIPNFVHDHVLRASLTNLLGDAFSNEESAYNNVVTKSFNVSVPATVSNPNNLEFVAFVIGADNKAINVRKSAPGENQTFEIIE